MAAALGSPYPAWRVAAEGEYLHGLRCAIAADGGSGYPAQRAGGVIMRGKSCPMLGACAALALFAASGCDTQSCSAECGGGGPVPRAGSGAAGMASAGAGGSAGNVGGAGMQGSAGMGATAGTGATAGAGG